MAVKAACPRRTHIGQNPAIFFSWKCACVLGSEVQAGVQGASRSGIPEAAGAHETNGRPTTAARRATAVRMLRTIPPHLYPPGPWANRHATENLGYFLQIEAGAFAARPLPLVRYTGAVGDGHRTRRTHPARMARGPYQAREAANSGRT